MKRNSSYSAVKAQKRAHCLNALLPNNSPISYEAVVVRVYGGKDVGYVKENYVAQLCNGERVGVAF